MDFPENKIKTEEIDMKKMEDAGVQVIVAKVG